MLKILPHFFFFKEGAPFRRNPRLLYHKPAPFVKGRKCHFRRGEWAFS